MTPLIPALLFLRGEPAAHNGVNAQDRFPCAIETRDPNQIDAISAGQGSVLYSCGKERGEWTLISLLPQFLNLTAAEVERVLVSGWSGGCCLNSSEFFAMVKRKVGEEDGMRGDQNRCVAADSQSQGCNNDGTEGGLAD
jgi:hypothetical protein